jgi:hypothetical protein
VLDLSSFSLARTVELRGDWGFDALSPDGRWLYAVRRAGAGRGRRPRGGRVSRRVPEKVRAEAVPWALAAEAVPWALAAAGAAALLAAGEAVRRRQA